MRTILMSFTHSVFGGCLYIKMKYDSRHYLFLIEVPTKMENKWLIYTDAAQASISENRYENNERKLAQAYEHEYVS